MYFKKFYVILSTNKSKVLRQLSNVSFRKLPSQHGDVSVMNRNFIRNKPEIINRPLQRHRVLSGQCCCVPFMQKKRAIRLPMINCNNCDVLCDFGSCWGATSSADNVKWHYTIIDYWGIGYDSIHTIQGDTCPTEWYMSNGHSTNLCVR